MFILYLRNLLDSIDLTILPNFTEIRYLLISTKDLKYLPTFIKNLKYPLNLKN